MTKRLVDIDDKLLVAAKKELGTTTMKDTVNAALAEVRDRQLRRRHMEWLRSGKHDLNNPEVMRRAWRDPDMPASRDRRLHRRTSALARLGLGAVLDRLGPLIDGALVATCPVVDLEMLFSAQSLADHRSRRQERRAFDSRPITERATDWALGAQEALARRGQHRLSITDLLIAGVAATNGLTVLHYDADYERIASVTRLEHEWVVPRGSL